MFVCLERASLALMWPRPSFESVQGRIFVRSLLLDERHWNVKSVVREFSIVVTQLRDREDVFNMDFFLVNVFYDMMLPFCQAKLKDNQENVWIKDLFNCLAGLVGHDTVLPCYASSTLVQLRDAFLRLAQPHTTHMYTCVQIWPRRHIVLMLMHRFVAHPGL